MFIQVIEGSTNDPAALHHQLDVWQRDLMPGAHGYLGSAGGCTPSGDCILIARFESREAAMANNDRPEQSRWWQETETCFNGPVTFHDSTDVRVMTHGSMSDAHFIQVMEGHVTDKARAVALEREADAVLAEARPDLLGAVTAYFGDDQFTEFAYFRSEADARRGEGQAMDDELAAMMSEWQSVMQVERFVDINDPWMVSP